MKNTHRYLIIDAMIIVIMILFFCIAVGQVQEQNVINTDAKWDQIIQLARTNQIELLELAMNHYKENIQDYQGTLYRQERISGKLGKEQVIFFRFKENPFSVFMRWEKNTGPVDSLLYVEGRYGNKMIVHPNGFFTRWIKSIKLDPHSNSVRKTSLKTCDDFGFYRIMQEMLRIYKLSRNGLEVKLVTPKLVDGCRFVEMEVLLPVNKEYQERLVVIHINAECLMPVYIVSYDEANKLIYKYIHKNLRFNIGLSDTDFDLSALN